MDTEKSFTFNRKLQFTAYQNVIESRSRIYTLIPPTAAVEHTDLWKIKPPDFSPKLYCTLGFPRMKKKILDPAIVKNKIKGLDELSESIHKVSSLMQLNKQKKENSPVFVTSYKPPAHLDLQLQFVKFGKFPSDSYKTPKPHNFRPCNENLPNIVTMLNKDPANITFCKSPVLEARNRPEPTPTTGEPDRKIITFQPEEPKWDARLILQKAQWPPMSASYTRHRRRRGVYTAFMDRVEEKLSRSWMK